MTQTPEESSAADIIESIFVAAVALPNTADRSAYLDQVCGEDESLRGEVDALLRAHDRANHLLDRPAPANLEQTKMFPSREQQGTVIAGRYKLLEAIGEGGMGTVWVAEQIEPVRRKVALKLIKAGMDSKSVLARFEAERQALAVMDHPNIAKVLDGGITESGRPYFVMEYVKGVPITEYCDATRLSVHDRLSLFTQVCQAVQHAHQKGIIHRDLKPSNVLVAPYDDRPVPKVIDFGLAKATHQSLTEKTLHTAHGMVLGTPQYMSPEQAQLNNLDVDTRSDIYSLGVLLYELLTGSTPLETQRYHQAAWDEVRRIIREEDPPRPSLRLSTAMTLPSLAACRQVEPARLSKLMQGELDWIVMKSLEKDRVRRYETASGFAADVQRYLDGEPVKAAPPSTNYLLRKFVKRHKAALSTTTAIGLILVAGSVVSTWQAVRASRAEDVARQSQQREADRAKEEQRQRELAVAAKNEAQRQRDNANTISLQLEREKQQLAIQNEEQKRKRYVSDMNLVHMAWDSGDIRRARDLINAHRLEPGQTDLRGFEWHYWNRRIHAEIKNIKLTDTIDPSGGLRATLSQDGKVLVLRDAQNRDVIAIDTETGAERWRMPSSVLSNTDDVVFDPVGRFLILKGKSQASSARVFAICDARTGDRIFDIRERDYTHGYYLHNLMSTTAEHFVSIFPLDRETDALKKWELSSGNEVLSIPLKSSFSSLSFKQVTIDPQGRWIVLVKRNGVKGSISFYDADGVQHEFGTDFVNWETPIAFDPTGKFIAVSRYNLSRDAHDIELRDASAPEQVLTTISTVKLVPLLQPRFSSDGRYLAYVTQESPGVLLIDLKNLSNRQAIVGRTSEVVGFAFSADSREIHTLGQDGEFKTQEIEPIFPVPLEGVDLSAQMVVTSARGEFLALTDRPGSRRTSDSATPKLPRVTVVDARGTKISESEELPTDVPKLAFSADGSRLLLGLAPDMSEPSKSEFRVLATATGQELMSLQLPQAPHDPWQVVGRLAALALDASGRRLAGVDYGDGSDARPILKIWDVGNAAPILSESVSARVYDHLKWSPDSRFLLATAHASEKVTATDGNPCLMDSKTGKMLWQTVSTDVNHECYFSPDSAWVYGVVGDVGPNVVAPATRDKARYLIVRDSETGRELHRIPMGGMLSLLAANKLAVVSADKRFVAAVIEDNRVAIWDLTSPDSPVSTLQCGWGTILDMAFSPDGSRFATSTSKMLGGLQDSQGDIKVWNPLTGEELLSLNRSSVTLAFDSSGQKLFGTRLTKTEICPILLDASPLLTQ